MVQWDGTRFGKASRQSVLVPAVAVIVVMFVMLCSGCGRPDITAEHARLKVDSAVYNLFYSLFEHYGPKDKRRAALLDSEYAWLKQRETECGSGEALDTKCAERNDNARLKELRVKAFFTYVRDAPAARDNAQAKPRLFASLPFTPVDVASSPQGDTLAVLGSKDLLIFDMATGRQRAKEKLERPYEKITYSANGRLIMIAPGSRVDAPILFYDALSGQALLTVDSGRIAAWPGGGGRYIAQVDPATGSRVILRDVTVGPAVGEIDGVSGPGARWISAIATDDTGHRLATFAGGVVTLYRIKKHADGTKPAVALQTVARDSSQETLNRYHGATDMMFSHDGKHLFVFTNYPKAILTYDLPALGTPRVFELNNGRDRVRPTLKPVYGRDEVVVTSNDYDAPFDYPKAFLIKLVSMRYAPLPKSAQVPERGAFMTAPIGRTGMTAYVNGTRLWTTAAPRDNIYRPFSPDVLTGPKIDIRGDYQVQAIGIESGAMATGNPHITGNATIVQVVVKKTAKPQVLVLASYKPVIWLVNAPAGNVRHILLSGPKRSHAFGIKYVTQTNIGRAWAWTRNRHNRAFRSLNNEVEHCLGHGIDRFQGARSGTAFFIKDVVAGGDEPESTPEGTAPASGKLDVYKWTDASGKVHYGDSRPNEGQSQTMELKIGTASGSTIGQQNDFHMPFTRSEYHHELVMTHGLRNHKPVDRLNSIRIKKNGAVVYFFTRITGLRPADTGESTLKLRLRVLDAANKVVFDGTDTMTVRPTTYDAYVTASIHPNTVLDKPGDWTIQAIVDGKSLFVEKRRVEF